MRKIIILLSCCIVLLLLGYTGYRGYRVWKQSHGMDMAKAFYAKADYRSAVLSLQQVLKANPRNIEACRLMANLTEAARSPESLMWRQRVLELNPNSFDDRMFLAQSALIFRDYALATNTLAGVADVNKNTAAFHSVAGSVALAAGQPDQAQAHFSESIRLDPTNPIPQVNLAVVRLHLTNALDMAEARIALQRIIMNSTNAILQSLARRELIVDAVRFNNMTTAMTLSKELAEPTNALFSDKILRLDVLLKTSNAELKSTLAAYQREAATDPAKLYDLSTWQMSRFSPAEALVWLQSLPMSTRTNQPAALLAAQCELEKRDWKGLQSDIGPQNWGELDFVRHALLARTLREQNLTTASTAEWGVALNAASRSKGGLISLYRLAAAWTWNTEAEEALWIIVKRYPEEKWAPEFLSSALMTWHRTRSMMDLFNIMLKRDPDNLANKNNLAMTAMLLDAQQYKPYDLAQEVYAKSPKNPSYVSTYAFSLYKQGKFAEALKVMQQLAPKDLESPSMAGYYGLILKANGNKSEAKAYLNRISKPQLMPEELELFNEALKGL